MSANRKQRADEVHARLFERTAPGRGGYALGVEPADQPEPAGRRARDAGRVADDLLLSYREQFNVGRRSLLDVLDAQNTRFNVQAQAETARMAKLYAQYRVLAASNRLIEALGVQMPAEAVVQPAREVRRQSDPAGRPAGE